MGLINVFNYVKTVIEWEKIAEATGNKYRVVSVRDYTDRNGELRDGFTLTLMVLEDNYDYGVDKNGVERENNVFQNFDVTVLNRDKRPVKGDLVSLEGFLPDYSYYIDYNLILRFENFEILKEKNNEK